MILKFSTILCCAALLAACASGPNGVRITNNGTSATSSKQGAAIRNLTSAEISQAVVGKSFQFTRSSSTGFVIYNADGTLDITDDQKGAVKGKWSATGNQYCESYGAAQQECGIFKYTGDAYFAANSRLVEMKV
jgi:uncharacterized Zn-binding protein involved in type VI secretion